MFNDFIVQLETRYHDKLKAEQLIKEKQEILAEKQKNLSYLEEAIGIVGATSDANTEAILSYISGIVNKALAEIFPSDTRRIRLEKTLYNGSRGNYVHINVVLETGQGKKRNFTLQTGTGVRQVVSFLYTIALIEVRKGRRILLLDEIMSGVHPEAKKVIVEIIKIFTKSGFQFAMVEYGINNLPKMYLVEKPYNEATVTPLDSTEYKDEIFIFNKPKDINPIEELYDLE